MKRIHLIISGDVQGVGFREWTKQIARRLDLTGWVKNRDDGTVEIVSEGDETHLKELTSECWKGPATSWVESVEETWEPFTDEFMTFDTIT